MPEDRFMEASALFIELLESKSNKATIFGQGNLVKLLVWMHSWDEFTLLIYEFEKQPVIARGNLVFLFQGLNKYNRDPNDKNWKRHQ